MKLRILKIAAWITLLTFTATTFSDASPPVSVPLASEIKIPSPAFQLEIPKKFGKVETLSPGTGPALIHIQTAHGNYLAQKNIRDILKHLYKNYGIKDVFVEGSAFKLEPEALRYFPEHPQWNLKIADQLARKALAKGPELFLLEEPGAQGQGIEDLEAYRRNLDAFRRVLVSKEKTRRFLNDLDLQIGRLSAPYLNKNLRYFLSRLEDYELNHLPLADWLAELKTQAKAQLAADLSRPEMQVEYPMLVRYFKLLEFEAKIDRQALATEKEAFLKRIASPKMREKISKVFLADSPLQMPAQDMEALIETLVQSLPQNFNYKAYPNLNLQIGSRLLESEIKGDMLAVEQSRLTRKIIDRLAVSKEEKQLAGILKAHRMLQKLFNLELTPAEYEQIISPSPLPSPPSRGRGEYPKTKGEGATFRPSVLVSQLMQLNQGGRVKDIRFQHLKELDKLFDKAIAFYRGAKERDRILIENTKRQMREANIQKAVVITGGFHAQPFNDTLTREGFNYALITPQINLEENRGAYLDTIFYGHWNQIKTGTVETPMIAHTPAQRLALWGKSGSAWISDLERELIARRRVRMKKTARGENQTAFIRNGGDGVFADRGHTGQQSRLSEKYLKPSRAVLTNPFDYLHFLTANPVSHALIATIPIRILASIGNPVKNLLALLYDFFSTPLRFARRIKRITVRALSRTVIQLDFDSKNHPILSPSRAESLDRKNSGFRPELSRRAEVRTLFQQSQKVFSGKARRAFFFPKSAVVKNFKTIGDGGFNIASRLSQRFALAYAARQGRTLRNKSSGLIGIDNNIPRHHERDDNGPIFLSQVFPLERDSIQAVRAEVRERSEAGDLAWLVRASAEQLSGLSIAQSQAALKILEGELFDHRVLGWGADSVDIWLMPPGAKDSLAFLRLQMGAGTSRSEVPPDHKSSRAELRISLWLAAAGVGAAAAAGVFLFQRRLVTILETFRGLHWLKDGRGFPRLIAARELLARGHRGILRWRLGNHYEDILRAYLLAAERRWTELAEMGEAALPALMAALADEDPSMRRQAGAAAGNQKMLPLSFFRKALKSKNPLLRQGALTALGYQDEKGAGEAVPLVIHALDDKDAEVQGQAVRSLGNLGSAAGEAVPRLIRMFDESKDPLQGVEIASVIGDIGGREAVSFFLDRLPGVSSLSAAGNMAGTLLRFVEEGAVDPEKLEERFGPGYRDVLQAYVEVLNDRSYNGSAIIKLGRAAFPALVLALRNNEFQEGKMNALHKLLLLYPELAVDFLELFFDKPAIPIFSLLHSATHDPGNKIDAVLIRSRDRMFRAIGVDRLLALDQWVSVRPIPQGKYADTQGDQTAVRLAAALEVVKSLEDFEKGATGAGDSSRFLPPLAVEDLLNKKRLRIKVMKELQKNIYKPAEKAIQQAQATMQRETLGGKLTLRFHTVQKGQEVKLTEEARKHWAKIARFASLYGSTARDKDFIPLPTLVLPAFSHYYTRTLFVKSFLDLTQDEMPSLVEDRFAVRERLTDEVKYLSLSQIITSPRKFNWDQGGAQTQIGAMIPVIYDGSVDPPRTDFLEGLFQIDPEDEFSSAQWDLVLKKAKEKQFLALALRAYLSDPSPRGRQLAAIWEGFRHRLTAILEARGLRRPLLDPVWIWENPRALDSYHFRLVKLAKIIKGLHRLEQLRHQEVENAAGGNVGDTLIGETQALLGDAVSRIEAVLNSFGTERPGSEDSSRSEARSAGSGQSPERSESKDEVRDPEGGDIPKAFPMTESERVRPEVSREAGETNRREFLKQLIAVAMKSVIPQGRLIAPSAGGQASGAPLAIRTWSGRWEKAKTAWSVSQRSPLTFVRLLLSPVSRWREDPLLEEFFDSPNPFKLDDWVILHELIERVKAAPFHRSLLNFVTGKALASLPFSDEGITRIDPAEMQVLRDELDEVISEQTLQSLSRSAGIDLPEPGAEALLPGANSLSQISESAWKSYSASMGKGLDAGTQAALERLLDGNESAWVFEGIARGQVWQYIRWMRQQGKVLPEWRVESAPDDTQAQRMAWIIDDEITDLVKRHIPEEVRALVQNPGSDFYREISEKILAPDPELDLDELFGWGKKESGLRDPAKFRQLSQEKPPAFAANPLLRPWMRHNASRAEVREIEPSKSQMPESPQLRQYRVFLEYAQKALEDWSKAPMFFDGAAMTMAAMKLVFKLHVSLDRMRRYADGAKNDQGLLARGSEINRTYQQLKQILLSSRSFWGIIVINIGALITLWLLLLGAPETSWLLRAAFFVPLTIQTLPYLKILHDIRKIERQEQRDTPALPSSGRAEVRAALELFVSDKFFPGHFDIVKDFFQEPFADIFAGMNRDDRRTAVNVAEVGMASLLADFLKPQLLENAEDLEGFERSQPAQQATLSSWSPTNLRGLGAFFSTLIQSWRTSFMRFIKVGRSWAWVWHPRSAGTEPTSMPSSSSSISTKYSHLRINNTSNPKINTGLFQSQAPIFNTKSTRAEVRSHKKSPFEQELKDLQHTINQIFANAPREWELYKHEVTIDLAEGGEWNRFLLAVQPQVAQRDQQQLIKEGILHDDSKYRQEPQFDHQYFVDPKKIRDAKTVLEFIAQDLNEREKLGLEELPAWQRLLEQYAARSELRAVEENVIQARGSRFQVRFNPKNTKVIRLFQLSQTIHRTAAYSPLQKVTLRVPENFRQRLANKTLSIYALTYSTNPDELYAIRTLGKEVLITGGPDDLEIDLTDLILSFDRDVAFLRIEIDAKDAAALREIPVFEIFETRSEMRSSLSGRQASTGLSSAFVWFAQQLSRSEVRNQKRSPFEQELKDLQHKINQITVASLFDALEELRLMSAIFEQSFGKHTVKKRKAPAGGLPTYPEIVRLFQSQEFPGPLRGLLKNLFIFGSQPILDFLWRLKEVIKDGKLPSRHARALSENLPVVESIPPKFHEASLIAEELLAIHLDLRDTLRDLDEKQGPGNPRAEVRLPAGQAESAAKEIIKKSIAYLGWAGTAVALGISVMVLPHVFPRYLPVLAEGWGMIGLVFFASQYKENYKKQILIMGAGVGFLYLGFHLLLPALIPSLLSQSQTGQPILQILGGMGLRFGSAFLGVYLAQRMRRPVTFEQMKTSLKWGISNGIGLGYYLYFVFFPFISQNISGITLPFLGLGLGVSTVLLKQAFDLGVANLFAHTALSNVMGAAFGENQNLIQDIKGLGKGTFWKSSTFRSIKMFLPINFIYWFGALSILWGFFPQGGWGFKIVHSVLSAIAIGFLQFITEKLYTPAKISAEDLSEWVDQVEKLMRQESPESKLKTLRKEIKSKLRPDEQGFFEEAWEQHAYGMRYENVSEKDQVWIDFFLILSAAVLSSQNPKLEDLRRLDLLIEKWNLKDSPRQWNFSLTLFMQLVTNSVATDDKLRGMMRLAGKGMKLPGEYRYKMAAFALYLLGMHVRSSILSSIAADQIYTHLAQTIENFQPADRSGRDPNDHGTPLGPDALRSEVREIAAGGHTKKRGDLINGGVSGANAGARTNPLNRKLSQLAQKKSLLQTRPNRVLWSRLPPLAIHPQNQQVQDKGNYTSGNNHRQGFGVEDKSSGINGQNRQKSSASVLPLFLSKLQHGEEGNRGIIKDQQIFLYKLNRSEMRLAPSEMIQKLERAKPFSAPVSAHVDTAIGHIRQEAWPAAKTEVEQIIQIVTGHPHNFPETSPYVQSLREVEEALAKAAVEAGTGTTRHDKKWLEKNPRVQRIMNYLETHRIQAELVWPNDVDLVWTNDWPAIHEISLTAARGKSLNYFELQKVFGSVLGNFRVKEDHRVIFPDPELASYLVQIRSEFRKGNLGKGISDVSGDGGNTVLPQSRQRPLRKELVRKSEQTSQASLVGDLNIGQSARITPKTNRDNITDKNATFNPKFEIRPNAPPIAAAMARAWNKVSEVLDIASSLLWVQKVFMAIRSFVWKRILSGFESIVNNNILNPYLAISGLPLYSGWTLSTARSEVRTAAEDLKQQALFVLAGHRRAGRLEKFIFSREVGRLLQLAKQSMADSSLARRIVTLQERVFVADQTQITKSVLGSLESDILALVRELQPEAEQPEPYWKPQAEKIKTQSLITLAEETQPPKKIFYEPGKLLAQLPRLSQGEVVQLLNAEEINWGMKKLREELKKKYPKATIPYFNAIADMAGGVGGETGFAIALDVSREYLNKIVEVFRANRRKPKDAAKTLGTNEASLRHSYTALKEVLDNVEGTELADEEDTPGNLLVLVVQAILDKKGGISRVTLEKETVDGKPHVLAWLRTKFSNVTGITPEQVQQSLREWLALADDQGRAWTVITLKDQLGLIIPEIQAKTYSYARAFWGLGLKEDFDEQYLIKDRANGHVPNNTGIAFGWSSKNAARSLRAFRDGLNEIEAKYKGIGSKEASEVVEDGTAFDALAVLAMTPPEFLALLNQEDVDWNFKIFFERLEERFNADLTRKKVISHLKSRGFDFAVKNLQIEKETKIKMEARLAYYNGIQKLAAQSFTITESAFRNLSRSVGIDSDSYEPPVGNLQTTFGVTREAVLQKLRAADWGNFSDLKMELTADLKRRTTAGKPVIENLALSYADFVRGYAIEKEFLEFVNRHRGQRRFGLIAIGSLLGFKNNQLRNMESILQRITRVVRRVPSVADGQTSPLWTRVPFANFFKVMMDWTRFRLTNDLYGQRPVPVLIHRSWYYDWRGDRKQRKRSSEAMRLFGENLERSVRDIQANHPRMEYFWIEMGPAKDGSYLYPAFYITGIDLEGQKITEVYQWILNDLGFKGTKFSDDAGKSLAGLVLRAASLYGYRLLGAASDAPVGGRIHSLADEMISSASEKYASKRLNIALEAEDAFEEAGPAVVFEPIDSTSWQAELDSALLEPAATLALIDQYTVQVETWLDLSLDNAQLEQVGDLIKHTAALGAALFGEDGSKAPAVPNERLAASLSAILTLVSNYRRLAAEKTLPFADEALNVVGILHDHDLLSLLPTGSQASIRELSGDIFSKPPFNDHSSAAREWELALLALEAMEVRNYFREEHLEKKILELEPQNEKILARHEMTKAETAKRVDYARAKETLDRLETAGQWGPELTQAAAAIVEVFPEDLKARRIKDENSIHLQIQTLKDREPAQLWDYLERLEEINEAIETFQSSRYATEESTRRVQEAFQAIQSMLNSKIGSRMAAAFQTEIENGQVSSAEVWTQQAVRIENFLIKLQRLGRITEPAKTVLSRTLRKSFQRLIDKQIIPRTTKPPVLEDEVLKSRKVDLQAEVKRLTLFEMGIFPVIKKEWVSERTTMGALKRLRDATAQFIEAVRRSIADLIPTDAEEFVASLESLPPDHPLRRDYYVKTVDTVVTDVMRKILSEAEFAVWQKRRESLRPATPQASPVLQTPVVVKSAPTEPAPQPAGVPPANALPAFTWEQAGAEAKTIADGGISSPLGDLQKNRQKEVLKILRELLTTIQNRQFHPIMKAIEHFETELAKLEPNHPLRGYSTLIKSVALVEKIKTHIFELWTNLGYDQQPPQLEIDFTSVQFETGRLRSELRTGDSTAGTAGDDALKPLPDSLLAELPDRILGKRIEAIRLARGIPKKAAVAKAAGIVSSTYAYVEDRDVPPSPHHLKAIARVLEVDPLWILTGKLLNALSELPLSERLEILRFRLGLNQEELVEALEKKGVYFEGKDLAAKRPTISQWESGVIPLPDKWPAIMSVLGYPQLFEGVIFNEGAAPFKPKTVPKITDKPKPGEVKKPALPPVGTKPRFEKKEPASEIMEVPVSAAPVEEKATWIPTQNYSDLLAALDVFIDEEGLLDSVRVLKDSGTQWIPLGIEHYRHQRSIESDLLKNLRAILRDEITGPYQWSIEETNDGRIFRIWGSVKPFQKLKKPVGLSRKNLLQELAELLQHLEPGDTLHFILDDGTESPAKVTVDTRDRLIERAGNYIDEGRLSGPFKLDVKPKKLSGRLITIQTAPALPARFTEASARRAGRRSEVRTAPIQKEDTGIIPVAEIAEVLKESRRDFTAKKIELEAAKHRSFLVFVSTISNVTILFIGAVALGGLLANGFNNPAVTLTAFVVSFFPAVWWFISKGRPYHLAEQALEKEILPLGEKLYQTRKELSRWFGVEPLGTWQQPLVSIVLEKIQDFVPTLELRKENFLRMMRIYERFLSTYRFPFRHKKNIAFERAMEAVEEAKEGLLVQAALILEGVQEQGHPPQAVVHTVISKMLDVEDAMNQFFKLAGVSYRRSGRDSEVPALRGDHDDRRSEVRRIEKVQPGTKKTTARSIARPSGRETHSSNSNFHHLLKTLPQNDLNKNNENEPLRWMQRVVEIYRGGIVPLALHMRMAMDPQAFAAPVEARSFRQEHFGNEVPVVNAQRVTVTMDSVTVTPDSQNGKIFVEPALLKQIAQEDPRAFYFLISGAYKLQHQMVRGTILHTSGDANERASLIQVLKQSLRHRDAAQGAELEQIPELIHGIENGTLLKITPHPNPLPLEGGEGNNPKRRVRGLKLGMAVWKAADSRANYATEAQFSLGVKPFRTDWIYVAVSILLTEPAARLIRDIQDPQARAAQLKQYVAQNLPWLKPEAQGFVLNTMERMVQEIHAQEYVKTKA